MTPHPQPSPITNPVTRTRTSSRVTYTRSPGPGPGPPQGSPVIVVQVRRLKVAGMGLEKPKLLCYVFILSPSVYSHSSLQHLQYSVCVFEIPTAWHLFGVRGLSCVPTIIRGGNPAYQCMHGAGQGYGGEGGMEGRWIRD